MPHNALLQAHTTLFPLTYYVLALCAALALTYLGSTHSAWLPVMEMPPTRAHSPTARRKFKQLVNMIVSPLMLSAPKFLSPSMAHNTMEACEIVCRLDHTGKIDDSSRGEKQKAATALLRDGPVSRCRIAQVLPQMCHPSRAPRILCNGLCAAQRFHVEGEEQLCRVGSDSLTLQRMSSAVQLFASVWRQATVLPRPSFPRLDHPDFSTKLSIWNRSDGCHRCVRLRP